MSAVLGWCSVPALGQALSLYDFRIMSAGVFWTTLSNFGRVGSGRGPDESYRTSFPPRSDKQRLGINYAPSFEFPAGSQSDYLWEAGLLVGGVAAGDTLVSTSGYGMAYGWQEFYSTIPLVESSNRRSSPRFQEWSIAEQQFTAMYSDSFVYSSLYQPDDLDRRLHVPLLVDVRQESMAWSSGFANRFLILDFWILNAGTRPIDDLYVGFSINPYVLDESDPAAWSTRQSSIGHICGIVQTAAYPLANDEDTLNTAWVASADGAPLMGRSFNSFSITGVLGCRVLRAPAPGMTFNWWTALYNNNNYVSWGPRMTRDRVEYDPGYAIPWGDRGRYHELRNGEVDYDQVYSALDFSGDGWRAPIRDQDLARRVITQSQAMFTISHGPVPVLMPGDSIPFTVAIIAADNFHRDPANFAMNFDPYDPHKYVQNLDFSDLIKTARWADWWFDNPGVDTDGDGDRGRAFLVNCDGEGNCDSVYYKGDGIPDWKGPSAPPPPPFEMSTFQGEVPLRWTGEYSETTIDAFSLRRDFEGYRLYLGKFDQDDQYSMVSSWDIEDYERLEYVEVGRTWKTISHPYPPEDWPGLMDDPDFNVYDYLVKDPAYAYRDIVTDTTRNVAGEIIKIETRERLTVWQAQAYNRGNEYEEAGYPEINAIQRVGERDTVVNDEVITYGIYEARLTNLNPAIPLYVSITAFDQRDYLRDFDPLESSQSNNSEYAHFIYTPDIVADSGLRVSVYPNP
ncbi:MAG: hypothetical protein AB1752_10405, partial [Candidatus Zixiibacteriota bacterium]